MMNVIRSEWVLLNRTRLWVGAALTTVAFAVVATSVAVGTAKPSALSRGEGLPSELLSGPGGATAGVVWALGFGAILVLSAFASSAGNELTRGTLRASLLHHPGRWSLIGGKLAARMGMAGVLMLAGLVAGAVTAAVVAPGNDIATIGWFGLDGMVEAGGDYIRLMAWAGGYALIGTTLAVLVRSTPIALAAGLLWFGPIENVIGEGRAWADRWFPGQLLRAVIAPEPGGVTTATASLTLLAYGAVLVAVLAIVLARRDVTS